MITVVSLQQELESLAAAAASAAPPQPAPAPHHTAAQAAQVAAAVAGGAGAGGRTVLAHLPAALSGLRSGGVQVRLWALTLISNREPGCFRYCTMFDGGRTALGGLCSGGVLVQWLHIPDYCGYASASGGGCRSRARLGHDCSTSRARSALSTAVPGAQRPAALHMCRLGGFSCFLLLSTQSQQCIVPLACGAGGTRGPRGVAARQLGSGACGDRLPTAAAQCRAAGMGTVAAAATAAAAAAVAGCAAK